MRDGLRAYIAAGINGDDCPQDRPEAEKKYGKVWDTEELKKDFEVRAFFAPFVLVVRRSDGVVGALTFQHSPRFYFDFVETPKGTS